MSTINNIIKYYRCYDADNGELAITNIFRNKVDTETGWHTHQSDILFLLDL